MNKVVAIGELLVDMAETEKGIYKANPGGAPANFLASVSARGVSAQMISRVGKDSFGEMLIKALKSASVGTSGIQIDENAFTTLAFVSLSENGEREFSFSRNASADTLLELTDNDLEIIKSAYAFHFGTLSLTDEPSKSATEKAVKFAKENGKIISFDPNLRLPLWKDLESATESAFYGFSNADIVKLSLEEAKFYFNLSEKECAEKLIEEFNCIIVFVTLGENGVYYKTKNFDGYEKSKVKVKPIDTTGAGDIFGGTALAEILKLDKNLEEITNEELKEISAFASTVASISTETLGGISSVPSEKNLEGKI